VEIATGLTKNQKKKLKAKARRVRAKEEVDGRSTDAEEEERRRTGRGETGRRREYSDIALDEKPPAPQREFIASDLMNSDAAFRRGEVMIIDLGNACFADSTTNGVIQTRQYRSPEVITGGRFGTSADMWSVACLLFEIATGEFLFDPHSGSSYDRDEDHLAQMIELLGPIPRSVATRGAFARELFNARGELRHIRDLAFWSLERVLGEKYEMGERDAVEFADFLLQMLRFENGARASASRCLQHPFLAAPARRHSAATAAMTILPASKLSTC
jgi:serine/threonine-protein kinase SRPK3